MPPSIPKEECDRTLIGKAEERIRHSGDDTPIRISAGHRILHHGGKCSRPHGHNYLISVGITGTLSAEGWIADKGDVTGAIDEWDHMFLIEEGEPLVDAFEMSGDADSLVVLDHPPTADTAGCNKLKEFAIPGWQISLRTYSRQYEVMAALLEERMLESFPETVSDVSVLVRETGELCASY
jgi:6-pyruvoyltetrahydropterin/6-carboxytetrahydropterin synthase